MNTDGKLRFLFDDAPAVGTRRTVVPGIDWVYLPLPFVLDHVNCWHISNDRHSCVIDTGIATSEVFDAWDSVLGEQGHPDTVLVTHFHPDHSGLAGWFAERGSQMLGSAIETGIQQKLFATSDADMAEHYATWYRQNGVADPMIESVVARGNSYRPKLTCPPDKWQFVEEGELLELGGIEFRVMQGRGHAPAMLMLYSSEKNVLIAADQVLPAITPNVSVMPLGMNLDPLSSFLSDIALLKDLPEETLVLPSHGLPFHGLHNRIHQLEQHHASRCDEILAACRQPQTAASLFPLLFKRQLDAQQLFFALGESLAHLRYLQARSLVEESDDNGVVHFQTT